MLVLIFCSQRSFSCVRTRGSSLTGDTSIITPTTAVLCSEVARAGEVVALRPVTLHTKLPLPISLLAARLETAHSTSLMSTGSSDSGTGSTSDQDQPLLSPASGQFSWPGPRAGCDNQSVYSEANTTMTSNSGLYVKMRHLS